MTRRPPDPKVQVPDEEILFDEDSPELTDEQMAKAGRLSDFLPELAAAFKRERGRPKVERPKEKVTMRLSQDVLEYFRGTGAGWQGRIDEILREVARKG